MHPSGNKRAGGDPSQGYTMLLGGGGGGGGGESLLSAGLGPCILKEDSSQVYILLMGPMRFSDKGGGGGGAGRVPARGRLEWDSQTG